MAPQLPCDVCREEVAVQMLTNLATGDTMTLGPSCLAQFYGQSVLTLLEAGYHKGPAGKCQACRRFHEQMTLPVAPAAVAEDSTYTETADQLSSEEIVDHT